MRERLSFVLAGVRRDATPLLENAARARVSLRALPALSRRERVELAAEVADLAAAFDALADRLADHEADSGACEAILEFWRHRAELGTGLQSVVATLEAANERDAVQVRREPGTPRQRARRAFGAVERVARVRGADAPSVRI